MRGPARRAAIDPFVVMEVVADAALLDSATGGDVLHLEVGQPSSGAPDAAVAAARRVLDSGDPLGYTPSAGLQDLRAALARRYRSHGVEVPPERIIVTVGASGACVLAFLAAFDLGDRVGVTVPGYPCYRQMLRAFGVEVVDLPARAEANFRIDVEALRRAHGGPSGPLGGVVLASPANPTGTVAAPEQLDAIAEWCRDEGIWLIADEIYHGITFGPAAATAASHPDAITIGSFSKYFSMTGWRIGWMVVPEALVETVDRLQQNLFLCAPALAQHAALGALDDSAGPELAGHVDRYRQNRDALVRALTGLGITTMAPADGAFYVYADTSPWHPDSRELCRAWLEDLHLAATPGIDFDAADGHRWVRFSVSGSEQTISAAIERLEAWHARRA